VAAVSGINVHLLVLTLFAAAVLGDSVNYAVGRYIGPKAFHRPQDTRLGRWLKPQYLQRTHRFYEKYGGFTIVIGRFVPIVRTFAPFLAGVGAMTYRKFLSYNVIGAAAWVASLAYAGFLFGNIPWVKDNLALIVLAIVIVTVTPAAMQFLRERRARRKAGR
jgi:membrane-associated protein